jgi:DNA-binding transcriptional ArsR family regulator
MELQRSDHKHFKAFANPLRLRMIGYFKNPRTVKQVADELTIRPHTLYHHIRVLEDCGVVNLVRREKLNGSIEEKYYQLTEKYQSGSGTLSLLMGDMKYAFDAVMAFVEEYKQSVEAGKEMPGYVCQRRIRINTADFPEIQKHMDEGIEKLCAECMSSFESQDADATFIVNLLGFLK